MTRTLRFLKDLGLISRLMLAVGVAIVAGGGVQTALLLAEGAAEHSARLRVVQKETLVFLAPLVADQALLGDYAAIDQLLNQQVKKGEVDSFTWTDRDGKRIFAQDVPDKLDAPNWFARVASIEHETQSVEVTAGGVGYGTLSANMTPVKATNRLWSQFIKQLQIVAVTLLLMLQFIWLIFRGNLGTLRMLAEGANRFSQGDHAVRIEAAGAPEVGLAAEAFNNMANNIESLIASLGQSEAKNKLLATIVEQSSEAIWTTDLGGRITTWNSGAAAMFGYAPAEAIAHSLKLGDASPQEEEAHLRRLVAGERFSYEARARTRLGSTLDVQVAVAPLLDDANRCIGRIAVARDVTQHKRSEEALRLAREAAEAASLAKSSFLARMSHEIRTPMNGVLGMTELLLETGLTATQRKYAETVQRSGKNLLGIINDLLDFSKIEAGKLELEHVDMDLRRTMEDIVELLAERAHSKGLDLACSIPAELSAHVKGDPLRLGQILTNLLGNAIKFTEEGSVVVRVESVAETDRDVTMRFDVVDTGVGISATAQTRIFEEFSQVDGSTTRKHEGSGLGLAISKQLVEMMGGMINVKSEPGVGSTFWFTATFEKQATPLALPPAAPIGLLTGVRALVLEASPTHRGILQAQMTNWQMSLRLADSPRQAIELLAEAASRSVPYDMAVIDFGLPGLDAFELARSIRARADIGKVRLVMLTRRHSDMRPAHDAGFNACLVKPVRQTTLYDSLVNVMSGRSQEALAAQALPKPSAAPTASVRGNILLVEDNVINQQVALGILQISGYSVTVVANGREALDACAQESFDLILMDCHMPEMDGFEATRAIRLRERIAGGRRIPIIALTANAMTRDREECLDAGMDEHLSKPFNMLALQELLERWMAHAKTGSAARAGPVIEPEPQPERALDRGVLDQLAKVRTNGRPELLTRVLEVYLAESPALLEKLKDAARAGDAPTLAASAHSLKGCSANVGATALTRSCAEAEDYARRAETEQARRCVAKIESEHRSVQNALLSEIESLAASNA
ncbi:MAG TPA: response regulator [Burkholderiales bacterium]|nr:response regulator [Burkholderiales bacterium]